MKTLNLKSIFHQYGWDKGFKFSLEIEGKNNLRIYVGCNKTKYVATGGGYDKVSEVIAEMLNDLIGEQKYSKDIYGNTMNYSNNTKDKGLLCGGTGFSAIKNSFESLGEGNTLNHIYEARSFGVYEVKFNIDFNN